MFRAPEVVIQKAKTILRRCLDHMREEMQDPRPGGGLIIQQLAQMLLVQALRAHMLGEGEKEVGWLFSLADKPVALAIAAMHAAPEQLWTVEQAAWAAGLSRTAFAVRIKEKVGETPMKYLTRRRMLLADDRLCNSSEPIP